MRAMVAGLLLAMLSAPALSEESDTDLLRWQECRISAGKDSARRKICDDELFAASSANIAADNARVEARIVARRQQSVDVAQDIADARASTKERRAKRTAEAPARLARLRARANQQAALQAQIATAKQNYQINSEAQRMGAHSASVINEVYEKWARDPCNTQGPYSHGPLFIDPDPHSNDYHDNERNPAYPLSCTAAPPASDHATGGVQ